MDDKNQNYVGAPRAWLLSAHGESGMVANRHLRLINLPQLINLQTIRIWPCLALRLYDFYHLGARDDSNIMISTIWEPAERLVLRFPLYSIPAGRLLRPGETLVVAQQHLPEPSFSLGISPFRPQNLQIPLKFDYSAASRAIGCKGTLAKP